MTSNPDEAPRSANWSSRFVFLMAAVGAAVGLGNLWRFPFQAGQNGGAAFVLVYLGCTMFIALPVLLAELAIGRSQGRPAIAAIRRLARNAGRTTAWTIGGWTAAAASSLVLSIYSIIAGKIMAFAALSLFGVLAVPERAAPFHATPGATIFWMSAFLIATFGVMALGLKRGVELAVSILMPIFFAMLAGLCVYALAIGNAGAGLGYLFSPRLGDLTPEIALAALGQSLFSLAVGGAVMITYGAYADRRSGLAGNACVIAGSDTLVALVAGVMIFPIIFAFGLDPAAGMSLIFDALPNVFLALPAGRFVGAAFFLLAFVAALTSSISMLMIAVTTLEDEFALGRRTAMACFCAFAWTLGAACAVFPDLSERVDFAIGSVLLPLGALASSLIAGWVAPRELMRRELSDMPGPAFIGWRIVVRYAAPFAIATIFAAGIDAKFSLGLFDAIFASN